LELTERSTVRELTARHRITAVESDVDGGNVVVCVEITDPELSRPVHVRFDLVDLGSQVGPRSVQLGEVEHRGTKIAVIGTYLGVVSEEN
jgi:hypothetical protein